MAGDEAGVTALQLDVKCEGLSASLLEKALAQAHDARLEILAEMQAVMPEPRTTLPDNVPRIHKMTLDPSHCGAIIGKEGRTITAIIDETGVENIDLNRADGAPAARPVRSAAPAGSHSRAGPRLVQAFCPSLPRVTPR